MHCIIIGLILNEKPAFNSRKDRYMSNVIIYGTPFRRSQEKWKLCSTCTSFLTNLSSLTLWICLSRIIPEKVNLSRAYSSFAPLMAENLFARLTNNSKTFPTFHINRIMQKLMAFECTTSTKAPKVVRSSYFSTASLIGLIFTER